MPFQPLPGTQDPEPRTEARPARALDDHDLRALLFDLLGRPPLPAERERWLGRARHELLDVTLGSLEFWEHWWDQELYYFLLIDNFRPSTAATTDVPRLLAERRLSVRDALRRIATTPTFDLRNPGADTFVTVVMEQFVGIVVQDEPRELRIGKSAYDGGKGLFLGETATSQADVVRIAVEHERATRHFLRREHARYLRVAPSRKALAQWARRQHRDPHEYLALVREWLLSPGYEERLARRYAKPNELWVRGLFVDLLARVPTHDEVEPLRNALDGLSDSRPLRSVLVRLLIDSGSVEVPRKEELDDPTRWIAGLFQRLLGRAAGEDELRAFVTAFHQPACRPRTILYALLSHSEYHEY